MSFRAFKARKLEALTEDESISSVNSWQQNLKFHLASCNEFSPFLADDFKWGLKSVRNRGLTDDDAGKSAAQKCILLNHMIGLIVSYCPENIRLEVDRKATSLKWIWQRVRRHYGFSKSEGQFLKLASIKLKEGERYESFFQRIMSHLYDNLLSTDSGIVFDGERLTADEEISPTVERLAVFLWLRLIDERLPLYVARVYSHDLQSKSLKDLQPEICQNLESLLMEISTQEDIRISYSRSNYDRRPRSSNNRRDYAGGSKQQKSCAFCKACNKPYTGHDISSCWSLSKFDKAQIAKAFQIAVEEDDENLTSDVNSMALEESHNTAASSPSCSRVLCMQSPHF